MPEQGPSDLYLGKIRSEHDQVKKEEEARVNPIKKEITRIKSKETRLRRKVEQAQAERTVAEDTLEIATQENTAKEAAFIEKTREYVAKNIEKIQLQATLEYEREKKIQIQQAMEERDYDKVRELSERLETRFKTLVNKPWFKQLDQRYLRWEPDEEEHTATPKSHPELEGKVETEEERFGCTPGEVLLDPRTLEPIAELEGFFFYDYPGPGRGWTVAVKYFDYSGGSGGHFYKTDEINKMNDKYVRLYPIIKKFGETTESS